ncbi:hypothetical protein [Variovorax sp. PMC12]|uniref:hypothetical protein n=1 Tax=Variovorax sp. PMC12 TaxID=2126319 RepID=UPI000D11B63A|nr:hypothetical protein [Variovorax sp. PMC12]AVQ80759.1 hypothetical protein C4F17_07230 [Variovorax sp. PMC12]
MSRLQINDNFGGQQLRTQASPVALTEQAGRPVEDTRWKALANAFADGAGLAETLAKQKEDEDAAAAKRWAQSMTVGELGKAIKEGKMMPSQSPVFVGTAQHIWGVNTHEAGMRDMTTKLTTGELKFNSPEEADTYLTEWRNTALAGQSKFAVAGFDKAYAQTRDKVMDHVAKLNDKVWVDNATVQATDYLANSFNRVAGSDFKGTPEEAASALMKDYQLLRHTKTLPDAVGKQVMGDLATRIAMSGRKDILTAFLDTEMDGIGSLRGFIGATKSATYENHARTSFEGQQRKRVDDELLPWMDQASKGELTPKFREWALSPQNKDFISSAQIHSIERTNLSAIAHQQAELQKSQIASAIAASDAAASRQIEAALVTGNLPSVMGTMKPLVLRKTGDSEELSDKEVKERAERIAVARTKDLPFEQQVGFFAQNGLKHPDWSNLMDQGFYNLNTIGVDSKGKPTGTLNETGKQAVELFQKLDTYGDYARSLMSEKQYARFSDIAFLKKMGRSIDDAAGLSTAADAGAVIGSDTEKLVKKVHAEVGKIQADPFYKWDWVQKAFGDNVSVNTVQMTSTLRRYATLLAHSGQYGSAEDALAASAKYLSDPAVSAKVNGTVYLRSEMPTGPKSRTQDEWFERYIEEVPKARAKELGFKSSEVRLEFDPTTRAYRGYVGGLPMENADHSLFVVTKDDIAKWYAAKEEGDVAQAAAKMTGKVQDIKDTRATAERVSDWAKQVEAGTLPKKAARTSEPEAPMRNIPDFWMTPEGQAAVAARKSRK